MKISGDADRYNHREGNDDYGQPRALFNLFDDGQKARLFPTSPRRCKVWRMTSLSANSHISRRCIRITPQVFVLHFLAWNKQCKKEIGINKDYSSRVLPLLNNSRESERSFYLQSERPFIFHSGENTTGQSAPARNLHATLLAGR